MSTRQVFDKPNIIYYDPHHIIYKRVRRSRKFLLLPLSTGCRPNCKSYTVVYAANDKFWAGAGYGGRNDNEVNLFLSVYIGNYFQSHNCKISNSDVFQKSYLPIVYAVIVVQYSPYSIIKINKRQ